jgi:CheY-specific phosphatase CheX
LSADTEKYRPAVKLSTIDIWRLPPGCSVVKGVMEKIRIPAVEANITNSIIETFQTMLGMDLVKVGQVTDPGLNEKRLVGAVHFAGEVVGTLAFHVSQTFARQITSAMLGSEESQSNDDEAIKDVLGELTNIVSGNLKSDFLNSDLACVISTPSITHGSDFRIDPSKMGERHQWVFRCKKVRSSLKSASRKISGPKPNWPVWRRFPVLKFEIKSIRWIFPPPSSIPLSTCFSPCSPWRW